MGRRPQGGVGSAIRIDLKEAEVIYPAFFFRPRMDFNVFTITDLKD